MQLVLNTTALYTHFKDQGLEIWMARHIAYGSLLDKLESSRKVCNYYTDRSCRSRSSEIDIRVNKYPPIRLTLSPQRDQSDLLEGSTWT